MKIAQLFSPYIVTFLFITAYPIEFFSGFRKSHILFFAVAIVVQLFRFLKLKERKIDLWFLFFFILLLSLVILSAIRNEQILVPFIGFFNYLGLLLYWVLYLRVEKEGFRIDAYINFLIFLALVVGVLGLYQYYFDISLFGMASQLNSYYKIENHVGYVRPSSIISSVQDYGLFMVSSLALCVGSRGFLQKFPVSKKTVIFLLTWAAIICGNKSVFIGIALIFLFIVIRTPKRTLSFSMLFFVSSLLLFLLVNSGSSLEIKVPFLDRFFEFASSPGQFVKDESVRFNVYEKIIQSTNFFIGNGIGTANSYAMNAVVANRKVTESFLLQLYWEGGVIFVISFFFLYLRAICNSFRCGKVEITLILLVNIIGIIFVQSFFSFAFFGIWGLVVFSILSKSRSKIAELV